MLNYVVVIIFRCAMMISLYAEAILRINIHISAHLIFKLGSQY